MMSVVMYHLTIIMLVVRYKLIFSSPEQRKTVDFSETIAASDLTVSRSRHLIEYMKVCEY